MQTVPGNLFVGDSGRFGGYTARTQAFLAATGITDSTIVNALNTMDIAIIKQGLENDLYWLHPFVGGTASTCKYNFMNVSTYMISFFGSGKFDSNGYTGNGLNAYGDFGFIPSIGYAVGSAHIATYDRTNSALIGRYTIGALGGGNVIWLSYFNDIQAAYLGGGNNVSYNGSLNITRLRIATRTSTTSLKLFRDGVQLGTTATASTTAYANVPCFYLTTNGVASYSDHNIAFGCGGSGLSDTKALALNTIVNNFQTSLGRAV